MDNMKKNIRLSSIIFEDEIINPLIGFHAFTGKGNAACFKVLQGSFKFQSTFSALGNDYVHVYIYGIPIPTSYGIRYSYVCLRYPKKRCE